MKGIDIGRKKKKWRTGRKLSFAGEIVSLENLKQS